MLAVAKVTVSTVGEVIREILECIHLMYVGREASHDGYKAGGFVAYLLQQHYQRYQDKKNPAQCLERKAETLYDHQRSAKNTPEKINKQAEKYLAQLTCSVKNLDKAKKYFLLFSENITRILDNFNNDHTYLDYVLNLKNNFGRFKENFEEFLSSIEPPPRQLLYIASLNNRKVISGYNKNLANLHKYIQELEQHEQIIAEKINEGLYILHTFQRVTSTPAVSTEPLREVIERHGYETEKLAEIMRMRLPNHSELADFFVEIIQTFNQFQQIDITKLQDPFKDDPNWAPLLMEQELIEFGQRIILHIMHDTQLSAQEKLLIAQIFFKKPVASDESKHIEIDQLAYEMASHLRSWQINKCSQLIEFLTTVREGKKLPRTDLDGVLDWLKRNEKKQNAMELLKAISVAPCCFSQCVESNVKGDKQEPVAYTKLKGLLPIEVADKLIQQHLNSYWGAIWEKNDTRIQLPPSFKSSLYPKPRIESDDAYKNFDMLPLKFFNGPHLFDHVSPVIRQLATSFIADLRRLKVALELSKDAYSDIETSLVTKKEKVREIQKQQVHAMGVARVRKSERRMPGINSTSNSLYPYLYRSETFNPADKKRQVPTQDDLAHLIFLGVDPNGVCAWEAPYPVVGQTNQLISYFMPSQEHDDSRTQAWLYAYSLCQLDSIPVLCHLFFIPKPSHTITTNDALATEVAIRNSLSLQAVYTIYQGLDKTPSLLTARKALRGLTPKMAQATERLFNQLLAYYLLALVRMQPQYRQLLPTLTQGQCVLKNAFKLGANIGQERLESTRLFISHLCTVFSEEDVTTINQALDALKKIFTTRFLDARKKHKGHRSVLYTCMRELIKGPIAVIKTQMQDLAPAEKSKEKPAGNVEILAETDKMIRARESVAQCEAIEKQKKKEVERQAKEVERQAKEAERQAKEAERQAKEAERQAKEAERQAKEVTQARETEERQAKEAAQARVEALEKELEAIKEAGIERVKALPEVRNAKSVSETPVMPENTKLSGIKAPLNKHTLFTTKGKTPEPIEPVPLRNPMRRSQSWTDLFSVSSAYQIASTATVSANDILPESHYVP